MGSIKGIRRGNYKSHRLQPNGYVNCARCNKSYKRRSSLLQHIRAKHLGITKVCGFCRKKYSSSSTLNRHQKDVHGVQAQSHSSISNQEKHRKPEIAKMNLSELSFEADVTFPCMANVLSLKETTNFGVHLVANSDIDVGKIVIVSNPFASIEYLAQSGAGCMECGKVPKIKVLCENCIDVFFCSNYCKASKIHRKICNKIFTSDDCQTMRLATEVLMVGMNTFSDTRTWLEFSMAVTQKNKDHRKCKRPFSNYGEILKLKEQAEPGHDEIARRVVKHILLNSASHFKSFDQSEFAQMSRKLFSLAYRTVNIISLNAFSETTPCTKGGDCVRYYIFDIISRFNHSCAPNLEQYLDDDDATYCITTRKIKSGEQLFISYLSGMQFETADERKNYLWDGWKFNCQCQSCIL